MNVPSEKTMEILDSVETHLKDLQEDLDTLKYSTLEEEREEIKERMESTAEFLVGDAEHFKEQLAKDNEPPE